MSNRFLKERLPPPPGAAVKSRATDKKFRRAVFSVVGLFLALVSQTTLTGAAPTAEVWFGAPAAGKWPVFCTGTYPSHTCSLPKYHWDMDSNNDGANNDGDWSVDLKITGDTRLYLYVAPQVTTDVITTKIERVSDACVAPRKGGKVVRVGVYKGTTKIGQAIYAHITPGTTPAVGTIARWNGYLGTVVQGLPTDPLCWTGTHVHFELYNQVNYACYHNRSPSSTFSSTNFLGFMGGSRVTGKRKPCP
jgi:hypothetical protein